MASPLGLLIQAGKNYFYCGTAQAFSQKKRRFRREEQRVTKAQEKAFEVSGHLLLPPLELQRGKEG